MGGKKNLNAPVIWAAGAMLALGVAFQNCSVADFSMVIRDVNSKTGNNNGGFDGKLWSSFDQCGDRIGVKKQIKISGDKKLARLVRDNCAALPEPGLPIEAKELVSVDFGDGRNAIVVWKGAIFDQPLPPPQIGEDLLPQMTVLYCQSAQGAIFAQAPLFKPSEISAKVALQPYPGGPVSVRIERIADGYQSLLGQAYSLKIVDMPHGDDEVTFAPAGPSLPPGASFLMACTGSGFLRGADQP